MDVVSGRCSEVGSYCVQSKLIAHSEFEDLRLLKYEGVEGADRLLQLLRGTSSAGFMEFKKILENWSLPMAPAHLLKTIESRENEGGS